ncbi:phosphotransferase [Lysinibacillus sp. CTST325]
MDNQKIMFICSHYDVIPKDIEIFRMGERVLAKIEAEYTYFLKGEQANKTYWEQCCNFANNLSEKGMNVSQYVKSKSGYYVVEIEEKVYSLERELKGEIIETITDAELVEIGSLLGVQHYNSQQLSTPFNIATSWSLFGGNQTDAIGDYDENELSFLDFKKQFKSYHAFTKIESLYNDYRQRLKLIWGDLPQGAIQGDFCYYNMLKQYQGSLAIYDFNLAGNEVYLNECIAVGIYHAWHVPYKGRLNETERFKLFIDSYNKERPLNELERTYATYTKAIIRAFRFDRVEDGILLESKEEQDLFLQETLHILEELEFNK